MILVLNQYHNYSKSNVIFSVPLYLENTNYLYPLFFKIYSEGDIL